MQFKLSVLALAVSLSVAACGGGGGGGSTVVTPPITGPVAPPDTSTGGTANTSYVCSLETKLDQSLNIKPVYTFQGLTSNWKNRDQVLGTDGEDFVHAVVNYSSYASALDSFQIKSKVFDAIYQWANSNAYVGTKKCYNPETNLFDDSCTQWIDPLGNDLSSTQDYNFVIQNVEAIRKSYSLIDEWAKDQSIEKHNTIVKWLDYWDRYMPYPTQVFFGLGTGYFQYEIQQVEDKFGISATKPLVEKLITDILPLINIDGSIVNRTTRGSRALWYHYTSINEIVTSMYLAKKAEVSYSVELDQRLHKAVEIFLNTLDNPNYILPWASAGFNNGNNGTVQDFNFNNWYDDRYGGSWVFLYMKWYPDNSNTARLKQKVPLTAKSFSSDIQFGQALGCITN